MAATSEARALPFFTDLYGQPLESGSIYIGQPGLDPVAYPAVVTSDIAGSVVVAQPIRTTHGHAVSAGAQIHMYCQIPYSITVLDAAGRIIYASLNETDPVAVAVASSSVQSAADLATLRARSGSSTNQVWVNGYGMYVYVPTDTTSPESIPRVIVGNDGSRYYLSMQFVDAGWVRASNPSAPTIQGVHLGWADVAGLGQAFLTCNRGISSTGGFILRTVNSDNTVELGRVTITADGSIVAQGGVNASNGDIRSAGNLIAQGGTVALITDSSRSLAWDAVNSRYVLVAAPLLINGSLAVTQASALANQQANGIGALALGNASAPTPAVAGTWVSTGTAQAGVFLYVRTA
jgi:hypothetical protein